jgi:hypothetical protein
MIFSNVRIKIVRLIRNMSTQQVYDRFKDVREAVKKARDELVGLQKKRDVAEIRKEEISRAVKDASDKMAFAISTESSAHSYKTPNLTPQELGEVRRAYEPISTMMRRNMNVNNLDGMIDALNNLETVLTDSALNPLLEKGAYTGGSRKRRTHRKRRVHRKRTHRKRRTHRN